MNHQITDQIVAALSKLVDLSEHVYDYWIGELYDLDDTMIEENWNERNLQLMEDDVMNLTINQEN